MSEIFSRNELFWGEDSQLLLSKKHVVVFGLGGVGGFCAEMLARAGVGELTIVDFDSVSESNINRQIIALNSTVGQAKTELFKQRLLDINPEIKINALTDFYTEKFNKKLLEIKPDFIADAIDSLRSKISLLQFAYESNISVVSSFGAGNRVNPEDLYVCDISEVENKNAPFISALLYQLKKLGIESGIPVVTSREKPCCKEKVSIIEKVSTQDGEKIEFTKVVPASTPFVASCSGIFMASYIVRKLIKT